MAHGLGPRIRFAGSVQFAPVGGTISVRVAAGADDGRSGEDNNGGFFSSTDNPTISSPGRFSPYELDLWARFVNVEIPQGATIDSATVTGTANAPFHNSASVLATISFEDVDDAVAPTDQDDHVGKARTTENVDWDGLALVDETEFISPSLVAVIQEVVDRPSWASGNAMQLLLDDRSSGSPNYYDWYSFEGDSAKAFILDVEWS